jgi:hypothetical protein
MQPFRSSPCRRRYAKPDLRLNKFTCRMTGRCLDFGDTAGHMKIAASEGCDRPLMMLHKQDRLVVLAFSLYLATHCTGSDSGVKCRTDVSDRTYTASCSSAGRPACQLRAVRVACRQQTNQWHAIIDVKPMPRTALSYCKPCTTSAQAAAELQSCTACKCYGSSTVACNGAKMLAQRACHWLPKQARLPL